MAELGKVEDTLFVPLLGRIYASKNFPFLLFDEKALALEEKIPSRIKENDMQKQYTLIASASRSRNMDRFIEEFLKKNPDGNIVELGCGLETTIYRHQGHKGKWYLLDLENVIEYRKNLLAGEKAIYLPYSAFSEEWKEHVENGKTLFLASGLFYYFSYEQVVGLLKNILDWGGEIVFDAVSYGGMKMMKKRYMKQVGHKDAEVFFYVKDIDSLAKETESHGQEEPYYRHIPKKGLKFMTKINMSLSDKMKMVKMIHLYR